MGDICGIISGTAATAIAAEAWLSLQQGELRRPSQTVIQILLSALVAALTILGKAFCKQLALDYSTKIVYRAAKIIWRFKRLFSRKKKHKHDR